MVNSVPSGRATGSKGQGQGGQRESDLTPKKSRNVYLNLNLCLEPPVYQSSASPQNNYR